MLTASPPMAPPPTRNATGTPEPEPERKKQSWTKEIILDDKQQDSLKIAYNIATKAVATSKSDGKMDAEMSFGKAYQAMVAAGMAGQIKRKYRGR